MTRRAQRGFTIIELMIALVVSSLLVGMILAIFSRMSLAYRGQQQIAGVQQVLAAARATIESDAKQAGFAMAQGFKVINTVSGAVETKWPVRITDSAIGPDQVAFFYADSSSQAVVLGMTNWTNSPTLTFDNASGFAANDLVVLSRADTSQNSTINPGFEANVAVYDACVLQVRLVSGANISFMTNGSWGAVNEPQCTLPASGTLMYKFVARGYRIDPNLAGDPVRAAVGALQQSAVGGLLSTDALNGWSDIAYGFTDIQTALQVYDHATDPSDTPDPDTDGDREWYSGAAQNVHTGTDGSVPVTFPLQISISLVARTDRDIEGVTTTATPPLLDPTTPTNLDNNTVGNRPSIALPSATDLTLQGSRIYRYITFQVDFRNIGVGK